MSFKYEDLKSGTEALEGMYNSAIADPGLEPIQNIRTQTVYLDGVTPATQYLYRGICGLNYTGYAIAMGRKKDDIYRNNAKCDAKIHELRAVDNAYGEIRRKISSSISDIETDVNTMNTLMTNIDNVLSRRDSFAGECNEISQMIQEAFHCAPNATLNHLSKPIVDYKSDIISNLASELIGKLKGLEEDIYSRLQIINNKIRQVDSMKQNI